VTGTAVPELDAVLGAAGSEIPDLMVQVEKRLAEVAGGHGELLGRQAGDTIAAGGKRLRPLLVFLAAGHEAAAREAAVRAAVGVELIHSASLVHDDVLDAADLRRGHPTVVAATGRAGATATGDFLFSRAFAELAAGGHAEDITELAAAGAALARGELCQREDAWNTSITIERYLARCELKTGRLFEAACRLGARAGSGPVEVLGEFGRRIGLAFQLLDDVLDVSGPTERTGKRRGTDLLDGTVTLPLIVARERDPAVTTVELRSLDASSAEELCDRIAASGALTEARRRALAIVAEAKEEIAGLPGDQRRVLDLVADGVVERYS
jgi:geranylgeranyl pyrophosphate synthase